MILKRIIICAVSYFILAYSSKTLRIEEEKYLYSLTDFGNTSLASISFTGS